MHMPIHAYIVLCTGECPQTPIHERKPVTGIEPAQPAWKAGGLPFNLHRQICCAALQAALYVLEAQRPL